MDELQKLLKESTKDMLSEENLEKIEKIFKESVDKKAEKLFEERGGVQVDLALSKMDNAHAEKLEKLLEDIDEDHTNKIQRVVEALENKHCKMLKQLVEKYEKGTKQELNTFKENMLEKLDKFFDLIVDESVPQDKINEAVENTHYKMLFEKISKMLSIGEVTQNNVVREGIMDAKKQIEELRKENLEIQKQNEKLIHESKKHRTMNLLSEKCKGLPNAKKRYIFNTLGNKSEEFINENFDWTLKMLDENENEDLDKLKEETRSKIIEEEIDRIETINEQINENQDPVMESYLQGLGKNTM